MNEFKQIPDTAGEYEIVSHIKSKDTENSYVVYDRICRRKAFLKSGRSELIENEARILSEFAGNGIPQIYCCFEQDGISCFLRQYIEGKSLNEYIRANGALSLSETIDIGISVCGIISRLHSADPPVIHRDIKTDNIIMSPDGNVYIIDFGISRIYDDNASRDTRIMGTPSSAPPEQFGYSQTDERSDVYSIGVMLKEAAEGYDSGNKKKISPALAAIIRRCTEFAPENRYKNAGDVKKALLKIKNRRSAVTTSCIAASLCICAAALCILGYFKTRTQNPEDIISADPVSVQEQTVNTDANPQNPGFYEFADSAVEKEVCRLLGKEQGTITEDDLKNITGIMLIGNTPVDNWEDIIIQGKDIEIYGTGNVTEYGHIKSLEDLSHMQHLHTAVLCNQNISDLSPLEGLNIKRLALHGNIISDITPLKSCPMLEQLYISYNPLDDFSPISDHKKLFKINAGATYITNLDGIAEIPDIRELSISECPYLDDFSSIEKMNKLDYLSLHPAVPEAIEAISRTPSITRLYVWSTEDLETPQVFSELKGLTQLLMDSSGLTSLEGIENFPKLTELQVRYNSIEDFSPISGYDLEYLSVTGNPIKDWSFLSGLDKLSIIFCDESHAPDVYAALGDRIKNMEIIVQ